VSKKALDAQSPVDKIVMHKARWNREWDDPNCALVQWPSGYAEIHGSRFYREWIALLLEQLPELCADAMLYREIDFSGKVKKTNDVEILELSLREMTLALDALITECSGNDGASVAPDKKSLMRYRGLLPAYCKNSFKREKMVKHE